MKKSILALALVVCTIGAFAQTTPAKKPAVKTAKTVAKADTAKKTAKAKPAKKAAAAKK